jgi:hypothetical protein
VCITGLTASDSSLCRACVCTLRCASEFTLLTACTHVSFLPCGNSISTLLAAAAYQAQSSTT